MYLTLQKSITRTPSFINERIKSDASESEERLPKDGSIISTSGGFQIRYSLLPEGAPSFETTSTSVISRPNIFDMYSAGFERVALHDIKRVRLSVYIYVSDRMFFCSSEIMYILPTAAQTRRRRRRICVTWLYGFRNDIPWVFANNLTLPSKYSCVIM